MTGDRSTQIARARKSRQLAIVIAVTMLAWMGLQLLGGKMGLPGRYAFLLDFAAIVALVWVLVEATRIWRARRDDKG
ncbi:DUF5337 domain-containing protein [Pseudooceanicola sp. CBS1P-1]|uniref:DUF5337 domain-containing protein n=1 Tax=Pseudooceanicola albus TaxID=2692189 RepID=A0A6L7G058_9RHOB|nr:MULTISPECIES: DUF5337 domain-containing protein [Pseudooceanicola]MBT9382531.1 DUF5337 domain-containing protein [Pseudooceanicola endophyticus]MXN17072.1 hypothetical protein [Pseudooceanicola albus]